MRNKRKISAVSQLHFLRLVYRTALFVMLLITYIRSRLFSEATVIESVERLPAILYISWAVFVIEMILRFFHPDMRAPAARSSLPAIMKKPAVRIYRSLTTTPLS